jgi:dolichol-phosphate mannosyltransferase
MKIVVVIPTYNEEANIGAFLQAINSEFIKDPKNEYIALVVDGNSKDKTQTIVKDLQNTLKGVVLLPEEKKAGLGAAYTFAFKHAMQKLNADVLVEMDADFQHRPEDLKKLVKGIEDGYDYVIGSRFIKGGAIPGNWALYRKILSYGASIFSKLALGIRSVSDYTSGFKASRVKGFADQIDFNSVLSKGFAYKLDLLFKFHKMGAKILEVPITFGLRDRGDSKMEKDNFVDSLKVVVSLALKERKSFIKFVIVGFVGLFVDALVFNIARVMLENSIYAAPISGLCGMATTFVLNNFWSFGERSIKDVKQGAISVVIYILSSLVPILVRTKLIFLSTKAFGDTFLISNAAFFVGILFGLIWNYTVYSRVIWKKRGV